MRIAERPTRDFFRVSIVAVALLSVPIALYAMTLLFDNSVHFSSQEYLYYAIPGALVNGTDIQWDDLLRGFNPWLFDGGPRPRFLNYGLMAVNVKLRLLSYQYFIPSANLSIGLIVHVLLSPVLFFFLCRKLLANNWVAILGTSFYVASVGFLSSVVFFAQLGKNVDHALTLMLLLALAILHEKERPRRFGEERPGIVLSVMLFNLICISIDELLIVSSLAGTVLFFRLFLPENMSRAEIRRSVRALFLYFSPFLAFLLFTAYPASVIGERLGFGWCDYLGWTGDHARKADTGPFLTYVYELFMTTVASFALPSPYPKGMVPYQMTLDVWGGLAVGVLTLAIAFLVVRRRAARRVTIDPANGARWSIVERLGLATVAYFVFQILFHRMGGGQNTAGWYYCALASIFLTLLVVSLFATPGAGKERFVILFLVPVLMVIQIANFLELNSRWRVLTVSITRGMLEGNKAYPNLVVTPDGPRTAAQTARMEDLWKRWKRGENLEEAFKQEWPISDGWFLLDINALQGRVFEFSRGRCEKSAM